MPDLIERYLAAVRQLLRLTPSLLERILSEIEEHLLEAAEREVERGALPEEAQRIVIERFGSPEVVARGWREVYPSENGEGRMWQRFTERARRVVFFAQEEAARLQGSLVDTEHLLLGLVREEDSFAGRVLAGRLGISLQDVREATRRQFAVAAGRVGEDMQLTAGAKRMIDLAYEEARRLSNNYIGTEHLLLGLIVEEEGLGGKVLRQLGADPERTRRAVQAMQEGEAADALLRRVKEQFQHAVQRGTSLSPEAVALAQVLNTHDPDQLAAAITAHLTLSEQQQQELQRLAPAERLEKLQVLLKEQAVRLQAPGSPEAGQEPA